MGEENGFETQLWIGNIETGHTGKLSVMGENVKNSFSPAWSEDGSAIAYLKTELNPISQQEEQNIFLIDLKTGQKTQLTTFKSPAQHYLMRLISLKEQ